MFFTALSCLVLAAHDNISIVVGMHGDVTYLLFLIVINRLLVFMIIGFIMCD